MDTKIIKPFSDEKFAELKRHITEVRKLFDWPGIPYHDANLPPPERFNRWYWHNLPFLKAIHNDPAFVALACETFGTKVKPSYVFLSMYGPEGTCPAHTDRPQCLYTIDVAVNQDAVWPIYIGESTITTVEDCKPYLLEPGQAAAYSGVGQKHYRKAMAADSKATYADLAFFHFADARWMGTED